MVLVCCVSETGWVFAPCSGDALPGRLKVTITKPPSHLVGGVCFLLFSVVVESFFNGHAGMIFFMTDTLPMIFITKRATTN